MASADILAGSPRGSAAGRPVPVLVNRAGGTAAAAGMDLGGKIAEACRAAGMDADVRLLSPDELAAAIGAHADHPLIVVGGGDGTLGRAAGMIVERGSAAALGILPLGTHNHLARQLGIPSDIAAAMRIVAGGRQRSIDAASVNGTTFLNNASIGLYPLLVRSREAGRQLHNLPKWLANLVAAAAVLRRLRHHRLRVEIEGEAQLIRTPLLFVGNNIYSLEGGHIGQRAALDQGKLSLFAVASQTRLGGLWFALRTLIGRADPDKDFAAVETSRDLTVTAHAGYVSVALDGELYHLQSPLRFAIRPRALRVMVPE